MKIILLVLAVALGSDGHLFDILSKAHDHIHSRVEGVANTVLGGLDLNFGAHVGVNHQQHPVNNRPPPETIVVVVKEEGNGESVPPGHTHSGYPGPPNNNQYGRPDDVPQGSHGGYPNPGRPYQNNYDRPNNFPNLPPNQNHYNGATEDDYPPNSSYDRPHGNTHGSTNTNNNYRPVESNVNSYDKPHQNHDNNSPDKHSYGSIYNPSENDGPEASTEKPDEPLLVPLHPNEYSYEGDKTNINAPKRETDEDHKSAEDDDDLPIDIRFGQE